jgi:hypothetical protein
MKLNFYDLSFVLIVQLFFLPVIGSSEKVICPPFLSAGANSISIGQCVMISCGVQKCIPKIQNLLLKFYSLN